RPGSFQALGIWFLHFTRVLDPRSALTRPPGASRPAVRRLERPELTQAGPSRLGPNNAVGAACPPGAVAPVRELERGLGSVFRQAGGLERAPAPPGRTDGLTRATPRAALPRAGSRIALALP